MKKPGWLDEFKVFISRGNVIDLAVGVVVGGAFTAIVTALVNDIINPLISLIIGGLDFSGGKGVPAAPVFTNKATEAAQALAVLGYSSQEVGIALKGVDVENLPLEEIIRQSLKKMVK